MTHRKLTLFGAALTGAMLAASAGATDKNKNSVYDSGDRGVVTSSSSERQPRSEPRFPGGQSVIPGVGNPMNPSESKPQMAREHQQPMARGDNPNLPNPVTPSGANESAPQSVRGDPTNRSGMEGPVGATR